MSNEELPDYKKNFLQEMEILRQQQAREQLGEEVPVVAVG